MHKLRVYIDTSVIGGCFDEEFEQWSNKLFDEFADGKKIAVISDITLEELEKAPSKVRKVLESIPNHYKEIIFLNQEAIELSDNYISEGIVSNKALLDTRHIALATVNNVDILVSWNFKHIVNYNKIKLYNSVNLKNGYQIIEIRNTRDIIDENGTKNI